MDKTIVELKSYIEEYFDIGRQVALFEMETEDSMIHLNVWGKLGKRYLKHTFSS